MGSLSSLPIFCLHWRRYHLYFNRATDAAYFKGLKIESSLALSHLILAMTQCLSSINILKSYTSWFSVFLKILLSRQPSPMVANQCEPLQHILGSTPIYDMAIFKVPKSILNTMESIRRRFFNGVKEEDRKISWTKWHTVLAAKKHGGLGVSSF
ncbi:hypothetical protein Tco_0405352 [Tanacetum coccineum]